MRAAVATRPLNEILQGDTPKVLLIDDVNPVYGVAGAHGKLPTP